jgi:hypothetical protein
MDRLFSDLMLLVGFCMIAGGMLRSARDYIGAAAILAAARFHDSLNRCGAGRVSPAAKCFADL